MVGERVILKKKHKPETLDVQRSIGVYPMFEQEMVIGNASMSAQAMSLSYPVSSPVWFWGYPATNTFSFWAYAPSPTYILTTSYPPATPSFMLTPPSSPLLGGATEWMWSYDYGCYYRYVDGLIEWA
jgi:hypothetical protein